MSIPSLSTTQVPQTSATGTTTATPGTAAQGPFGSQLQSLLGGKSSTPSAATATAYQSQPSRGAARNAHHPRGRYASSTDTNAANGTQNSAAVVGAPSGANGTSGASGTSGSSGTSQQAPGGVLLTDMMRGLQAYGSTTTLA